MATTALKWLKRIVVASGAIIAAYLLAALAGSLLPANRDWQSPDDGIELFIETNGLHTGWGHAGVYRNTREWSDLDARDAISAVFGSDDVLIHVYHLKYPQAYPHYRRRLIVSEAEYRKIATAIEAQFVLDDHYRSRPSPGYAQDDLFYAANGHYNAFYTCNNWTSDILQQAGIRTGRWTPFQGGVMRWFPESAE